MTVALDDGYLAEDVVEDVAEENLALSEAETSLNSETDVIDADLEVDEDVQEAEKVLPRRRTSAGKGIDSLMIRRAIESREEERRLAQELDYLELDFDEV